MLVDLIQKSATRLREISLRLRGVVISSSRLLGRGIDCRPGRTIRGPGRIEFGCGAWIETAAILHAYGGQIRIGENSFIGPSVVIYGHGSVEIGNDCLLAMHCRVLSSEHQIPASSESIRSKPDRLLPTKIGNDVWLGAGVTVLGGVSIGDHCVVGAGAVVTKDLPPRSVALGVPAKVVRVRSA